MTTHHCLEMKSYFIKLILCSIFVVAGVLALMAQTPEQLYQKGQMEEGEGELKAANYSRAPQPLRVKENSSSYLSINNETIILARENQFFNPSVLHFLKSTGKLLISGGFLAVLLIFILLWLIILFRISYADNWDWKYII